MADKIFVDGFSIKSKETQYGEILKLGIKVESFMDFLGKYTNDKGYLNVEIKKGKSNNWYAELNTYKKEATEPANDHEQIIDFGDLDDEEVPF